MTTNNDLCAAFWDNADLDELERVALSVGISKYQVRNGDYAPLTTYWRYIYPNSKERLAPKILNLIEEKKKCQHYKQSQCVWISCAGCRVLGKMQIANGKGTSRTFVIKPKIAEIATQSDKRT